VRANLRSFELYLATRTAGPKYESRTRCTGCFRPGEPMSSDGYCEQCLYEQFGYDRGEQHVLDTLLGGAVHSAMRGEMDPELIVAAVQRAITQFQEEEYAAALTRSLR
jgi:hypothetical protein